MLQQVQQLNRDLHRSQRLRCPGTQELGVASPRLRTSLRPTQEKALHRTPRGGGRHAEVARSAALYKDCEQGGGGETPPTVRTRPSDQPRQAQRRQRNATRVGCPGWRRPMDTATAGCTLLLIAETDHGPPDQPVPAMAPGVRRRASGRITDAQLCSASCYSELHESSAERAPERCHDRASPPVLARSATSNSLRPPRRRNVRKCRESGSTY